MAGQVVHVEIPSDDTSKGRAFWSSLLGWQFQDVPGPFEYHMANANDQHGVAITNMEPGKRGLRVYFDVEDINAGVQRVRDLGGDAGEPAPVPGMGWFAVCNDVEQNQFGLWQNDPSAPAPSS
jgi:predicted enzyme related to lactoylglutathione lyase